MDVIIRYTEGHPTRLQRHPRLALMVALLGQPISVKRSGISHCWRVTWRDGFEARVTNPWAANGGDWREVLDFEVGPDAYAAALKVAEWAYFEAVRKRNAISAALHEAALAVDEAAARLYDAKERAPS